MNRKGKRAWQIGCLFNAQPRHSHSPAMKEALCTLLNSWFSRQDTTANDQKTKPLEPLHQPRIRPNNERVVDNLNEVNRVLRWREE
ncbi:hypothetical protein D5086_012999 [Populus alba]|uniref:Uncharacterized protein n=1 Tax=Populus alba TaxID=43335 RepID=A0ACC4C4J1_POPAL